MEKGLRPLFAGRDTPDGGCRLTRPTKSLYPVGPASGTPPGLCQLQQHLD